MERMAENGWLDHPQEWRAMSEEEGRRHVFGQSPLKDRLGEIVKAGAAHRSFLLRREPLTDRKRLSNAAFDYRRR